MKELYFFDETFYWGRSGKRATVIEAECELMQSVRPDELREEMMVQTRSENLYTTVAQLRADFDQIFAALFPGTAYTDRGRHEFDSFPLGSVPRKAKIQET